MSPFIIQNKAGRKNLSPARRCTNWKPWCFPESLLRWWQPLGKFRRMKRQQSRSRNTFLTAKIREEKAAVISLGKLHENQGYSCNWTNRKHVSTQMLFTHNGTRESTFRSQFRGYQRRLSSSSSFGTTSPTSSRQKNTNPKPIRASIQCEITDEKNKKTCRPTELKIENQFEKGPRKNSERPAFFRKNPNDCKNSRRFLGAQKFTREFFSWHQNLNLPED